MSLKQSIRPQVFLERIFLRKLQWHSDRKAVLSPSLAQPKLNVQLDIRHNPLPGYPLRMKLELVLSARCDSAGDPAFEAKIHLAGLFKLQDPQHAADPHVIDFCAAQVYPHMRRLFASQTLAGGFQGLLLHDRHLETALYRLFMGTDTPRAGFAEVFGTLPVEVKAPVPPQPTAPAKITRKKRSGPPVILRVLSRRALRSPYLHLVLSIPIWSGLFIGIGWWLAERDHLQTMFGPSITAMVQPETTASNAANSTSVEDKSSQPPKADQPSALNESKPSASAQILRLEKDGRDWLDAQSDSDFTVILAKSPSARGLVDQIDDLALSAPVYLVPLSGNRYAAVSGSFNNAPEAQRDATRLAKRWSSLKPEVLSIAKLRQGN